MKAIETDEVLMIDRSMVLEGETIRISSTSPDSEAHCSRDFVRIADGAANRLYAVRRRAIISVSTIQ